MIIVTQAQLRNKDTEAIILLRNEIKASFNTNAIDYFTISAVAEILYNKFKHKKHDIIYHTFVVEESIYTKFPRNINYQQTFPKSEEVYVHYKWEWCSMT